jgi:GAF domain-containing protein
MRELDEKEFPLSLELLKRLQHRTAISTPLVREGIATGAIVVRRNEVRPFTDRQVALLSTFADQAAIAIENVRLFDETIRLLQESNNAPRTSGDQFRQEGVAAELEFQKIIDLVGDKLREVFTNGDIGIRWYDPKRIC